MLPGGSFWVLWELDFFWVGGLRGFIFFCFFRLFRPNSAAGLAPLQEGWLMAETGLRRDGGRKICFVNVHI